MKGERNIVGRVLGLLVLSIFNFQFSISARELTTEQEQQFTYYWYAARQAIEKEDYPQALVLLEFCNAIKPDDGHTLTCLGLLYNGVGEKEKALETFRKAFEADPRDQWYKYCCALMEQRTEGAQKEVQRVLERAYKAQGDPKNEYLLEQLKRLYISQEDWKPALKMQEELDLLKGYNAISAMTYMRIYFEMEKPKKALAAIDKYLELDPTNMDFVVYRIEVLEQLKAKPAELYAAYEEVLRINPMYTRVLNNYAYLLATHKGDLLKAERMSQTTIREEPDNPVYLDTYGWILHLKGQDELAKFYLNKALQNTKSNDRTRNEIQKHLKQVER